MVIGIWQGGAREYRNAIAVEYKERLGELKASLKTAVTDQQREVCREQIQALKKDYREKVVAIRWSNFSTPS